MKKYPFSAYDSNLCLRPDAMMWAIMLFLLRPYVITVLSIVNRKDKTFLINYLYGDKIIMIFAALAAIPAAFVTYAFLKRLPKATERIRWIWAHGRELLAGSLVLNIILIFVPFLSGMVHEVYMRDWLIAGFCVYALYYLFTEERVSDTFQDFPKPIESD